MRHLTDALAYIDDQDSTDVGWAYQLTFSDDHQESGPLGAALDDGGEALMELRALIAAWH